MASDFSEAAFYNGIAARKQLQFAESFNHFTKALDIYVCAGYSDPCFLSEIFWQRADVSMMLGSYNMASEDIAQAIKLNGRPHSDSGEANKWLNHATNAADPVTSLSCCSAALHYSKDNCSLQRVIHGFRAAVYHEIGQDTECDKDIKKCRRYDPEIAKERGWHWKNMGIRLFDGKDYQKSFRTLQLAERFLTPFENNRFLIVEIKQHLHDRLNFMASAAWNLKQFTKSLQAGKKCYELNSVEDKIEASRWRMKGNEILKDCKYEYAVECYSLAIQYAPLDDAELQGILYSNRSSAYFRAKQYRKAKEDAEECLKYRPQWSKVLEAATLFLRERKFLEASENFEKGLDFMRAVDCLLQANRYDLALHLITKRQILMRDENELPIVSYPRADQRNESICYQAAEYYLKRGQLNLMISALGKLSETKDRITFLQKNGCVEQAAELMLKEGKAQEAAEMMRCNGKFLEAASFTSDDVFAAECYLITARAIFSKEDKEKSMNFEETKELFEAPLQRAAELYEGCGDLNGQAEVQLIRGRFHGSVNGLNDAGGLYYKAYNYAGLAECFILLIDMENGTHNFSRPKVLNTVQGLLHLILALHKKNLENIDRTVISMCEAHFGLADTGDTQKRKMPRLENVRFSCLETEELIKNEEIALDDAYNVIRKRLYEMAVNLIRRVNHEHQCINKQYKLCSRYLSGTSCKDDSCKYYHGVLTRQHFVDRFYSLCLLIHVDAMVAKFLKELKHSSCASSQATSSSFQVPSLPLAKGIVIPPKRAAWPISCFNRARYLCFETRTARL